MDDLQAMYRVCRHVKQSGDRCEQAVLPGMNFCFQHIRGKLSSLVRDKSIHQTEKIDFEYPGSRAAIQHNIYLIMLALEEEKLDTVGANTYLRILRLAEQNLTRWERDLRRKAKEAAEKAPAENQSSRENTPENKNVPKNENESGRENLREAKTNPGATHLEEMWEGDTLNRDAGSENGTKRKPGAPHLQETQEADQKTSQVTHSCAYVAHEWDCTNPA